MWMSPLATRLGGGGIYVGSLNATYMCFNVVSYCVMWYDAM